MLNDPFLREYSGEELSKMNLSKLKIHPLVGERAMISLSAAKILADDIKRNGVKRPIVLYEGMIVEGSKRHFVANRYLYNTSLPYAEFIGTSEELENWLKSERYAAHIIEDTKTRVIKALEETLPDIRAMGRKWKEHSAW